MTQEQKPFYNKEILFHSAQGFFDIGYHLAREVKKDESIKGFQRLAAAVVNFSFATELMLKGLHLLSNNQQTRGHRFWALFYSLPKSLKQEIEKDFKRNRCDVDENLTSYKMSVSKVDEKTKDGEETTEIMSVKDLLILHNNSFENWRYLFEIRPGGYEYEYNFPLMAAFLKTLVEKINHLSRNSTQTLYLEKKK